MFFGYFTPSGPGYLALVEKIMNSLKYLKIIKRKMLPLMRTLIGVGLLWDHAHDHGYN